MGSRLCEVAEVPLHHAAAGLVRLQTVFGTFHRLTCARYPKTGGDAAEEGSGLSTRSSHHDQGG
jgi:hypothetical protein